MRGILSSNLKKKWYMKTNKYSELIKFGLKQKTLMNLSEADINKLYKNLIESKKENKEATTSTETLKKTDYTASEVTQMQQKGQGINVTNGEVSSLPGGGLRVLQKQGKSEAPKNKVINDGEMSEEKSDKNNPWAICTASVGRRDKKKYERCVKDVKKSIKEGTNPYEVLIENKITSLVEKYVKPKMKKGDIIDLVGTKKMDKPIGKMFSIGKTNEESEFWNKIEKDLKAKKGEQKEVKMSKSKTKGLPNWLKFNSLGVKLKK